jgi:hypothetical protein
MIEHKGKFYEKRGTQKRAYTYAVCPLCSKEFVALLDNVKKGNTNSCGCFKDKHAYYNTPTYKSWQGLKERCDRVSNPVYKNYGGRGISYDLRWKRFNAFLEDMGLCPEGMSIDRIDNNGNYTKENCRWATYEQQANNRRSSYFVSDNGQQITFADWCRKYRKDYKRAWHYHKVRNVPIDKLLSCL